jgi:Mn2+/Fe2+ NRAMP family transporter
VLAGSSAFALAEAFDWNGTLDAKPPSAIPFYSVIVAGIGLGVVADLMRLDAVWALYWSAVVNGFVAIPLLIGIVLTGNRADLMGRWCNGRRSQIWLWITIALMTVAAIGVVLTSG